MMMALDRNFQRMFSGCLTFELWGEMKVFLIFFLLMKEFCFEEEFKALK